MSNGSKPPGAVRVVVETLAADNTTVTSTQTIDIPCGSVAPDTVRDEVVKDVTQVQKKYLKKQATP